MNETRFIELLNLYVDQQLSPQEAAELEAEIQTNPVRHRTYQQYCRMQKACAQLFEHERSAAPASTALSRAMADADRKIVAFPEQATRRSIWPVGFSLGAVATAACVAFVFVWQTKSGGPVSQGTIVATAESGPAIETSTSTSAAPSTGIARNEPALAVIAAEEFKPVFTVQPLRFTEEKSSGLFISTSAQDSQLLDWTQQVEFKPLRKVSADEFVFDQRSTADKPVVPRLTPAGTTEQSAEPLAAFEFTK